MDEKRYEREGNRTNLARQLPPPRACTTWARAPTQSILYGYAATLVSSLNKWKCHF